MQGGDLVVVRKWKMKKTRKMRDEKILLPPRQFSFYKNDFRFLLPLLPHQSDTSKKKYSDSTKYAESEYSIEF
jgi:hypothetical protein